MSEGPALDLVAVPPLAPARLAAPLSIRQRNTMLILLMLVGVCSTMDRAMAGLLLEPIKKAFSLSDAQLGMVAGLAFALAHAVVSVPAGALADRVNRTRLIASALAVWSVMTALCGLAASFPMLLLARMGVGAGEAGGQSACLSVVSDLFPERQRATAVSIYMVSSPIGGIISGALIGVLVASHGWRGAMIAASVPGVVMAVVLVLAGREPPREGLREDVVKTPGPALGEIVGFILSQRALIHLFIGLALVTFTVSALGAFGPSFFIRYHHMKLQQIAPILGAASGVIGVSTMLGSGLMADWLGKRDQRWRLWIVSIALLAMTPFLLGAYMVSGPLALPLYLSNYLILNVWMGPGLATAQSLTIPKMRSTVAAIMFVVNGLLGFGFGPVIAGALSDALAPRMHAESLRGALVIVTLMNVWAAVHFFLAARSLAAGLARVRTATAG